MAKINQGLRGHMKNGGARGVSDEACAAAARRLVDLAKDDPGLLQLLQENNGKAATYILAESAFKFRTDEEIADRLNALRANVEELRMATNGDAQMFKLAIKMLAVPSHPSWIPPIPSSTARTPADCRTSASTWCR